MVSQYHYHILMCEMPQKAEEGLIKLQNSIFSFHCMQEKIYQDTTSVQNLEHINRGVDFVALYLSNFKNPYGIENSGGNWYLLKKGI